MTGKPPGRLMRLPLGRDRELDVEACGDVAGRHAIGGRGLRFPQRGVDRERERAVHPREGEEVPTGIDNGDALRHSHRACLRHGGNEELHRPLEGELQRGNRIGHGCTSQGQWSHRSYGSLLAGKPEAKARHLRHSGARAYARAPES